MGFTSHKSFQQFTTPVLPGKSHLLYGDSHFQTYPLLARLLEAKNSSQEGNIPPRFLLKTEKDSLDIISKESSKKAKRNSDIESLLFLEVLSDETQRKLLFQICESSRLGNLESLKTGFQDIFLDGSGNLDANTLPFPLKNSPLHIASTEGHLHIVEFLIKTINMDPDLKDENLETPLMKCCKQGHIELAEFLLENDALSCHIDSQGWTALHNAACFGHLEIVKLLVERGPVNVNPQSHRGFTPLMDASAKGYTDVVKYLLFQSYSFCDPTIKNQLGETAYAIAAIYEHVEICDALVAAESIISKNVDSSTSFRTDQVAFIVSVYENERCPPPNMLKTFMGTSAFKFSSNNLLNKDQRAPFSFLGSNKPVNLSMVSLPSTDNLGNLCNWSWQTEWLLHTESKLTDSQTGWQYAQTFDTPDLCWSPTIPRNPHNSVRRRRWFRVAKKALDVYS